MAMYVIIWSLLLRRVEYVTCGILYVCRHTVSLPAATHDSGIYLCMTRFDVKGALCEVIPVMNYPDVTLTHLLSHINMDARTHLAMYRRWPLLR